MADPCHALMLLKAMTATLHIPADTIIGRNTRLVAKWVRRELSPPNGYRRRMACWARA
jgi:hypothetical protein